MSERLDHRGRCGRSTCVGPLADGARGDRRPDPPRDGRRDQLRAVPRRVLWDAVADAGRRRGRAGAAARRRDASPRAARLAPPAGRRAAASSATARRDSLARPPDRRRRASSRSRPPRSSELKAIGALAPRHVTVNDVLLAGGRGRPAAMAAAAGERAAAAAGAGPGQPPPPRRGRRRARQPRLVPERRPAARRARPARAARRDQRRDRGSASASATPRSSTTSSTPWLGSSTSTGRSQRLAGGPHEFSLSISNVPGPRGRAQRRRAAGRAPLLGRRARRAPRASGLGDLVRGLVGIGLCTDPEALAGRRRRWRTRSRRSLAELRRGGDRLTDSVPRSMALKLGLNLGYWGIGPQGDEAVEIVRAAEARGLRLGLGRRSPTAPTSSACSPGSAPQTETIKLGAAIMQVPARPPAAAAMAGRDDRRALRRALHLRLRALGAAGLRGLVRGPVREALGPHPRVHRGRARDHRPRGPARARGRALPAADRGRRPGRARR